MPLTLIDCYVIFNEPTDREDWLARCVASLEHPAVNVEVCRFATSGLVAPRRHTIIQNHDPARWLLFADPDDEAVNPGYTRFMDFLQTTTAQAVFSKEVDSKGNTITGHHLVALRGAALAQVTIPEQQYETQVYPDALFPEVTYLWHHHAANTRGRPRNV